MIILVDAMGGDNAPREIVLGCMDAISESDGFDILLIGDSEKINNIISEKKFVNPRLKIHHASDVITGEDVPTKAIRNKKDSSMVVGFNLLKEGKGDVFLSAGNTGALLAGGLFILGRIKGVDRPALAPIVPTATGATLIIDGGANTVCKPINLLQFGVMGSLYMKEVFGIESPKVGIVNVGSEEKKGNEFIKQSSSLLSKANINFIGNVEGNQIPEGKVDVAVCDGFTGNVVLKFMEGLARTLIGELKGVFLKSFITKVSYLAIKKHFKNFSKKLDASENGGAPLLGINGRVIKGHGNSKAKAIKSAINKAYVFAQSTMIEQLKEQFINTEVEEIEQ